MCNANRMLILPSLATSAIIISVKKPVAKFILCITLIRVLASSSLALIPN